MLREKQAAGELRLAATRDAHMPCYPFTYHTFGGWYPIGHKDTSHAGGEFWLAM